MKARILLPIFLLLVSGCCLASSFEAIESTASAPVAPVVLASNEVAVTPMLNLHTSGTAGFGVNATVSHYFNYRYGLTADAEYLNSNRFNLKEYAFRMGPTFRFKSRGNFQPFARGLVGIARWSASYTANPLAPTPKPGFSYPYITGVSYEVGGGTDVKLIGPFSARFSGDFMHDWDSRHTKTRLIRLSGGLVYCFDMGKGR